MFTSMFKRMLKRMFKRAFFAATLFCGLPALAADANADRQAFQGLYQELIETNTTASSGSCTEAAQKLAARMKAAGFSDAEMAVFTNPELPKDGGLTAQIKGTNPKEKALLLLAHLDVVEAKREDWVRDPFVLAQENGKFYGRGTVDDKHMAAIWVDTLIRFKKDGYRPKRTIKMALTCGEEGGGRMNGARWLVEHKREAVEAGFGLNEGGIARFDENGKPQEISIEAAEKTSHNYKLQVTNPGGHSSLPVKDNAIYHLAHALIAIEGHSFPIQLIDANRGYFEGIAKIEAGKGHKEVAAAIAAMLKNPADPNGEFVASQNALWNSTLRTTCVATELSGGHATNALPQRADANINCRIFPGVTGESVKATLIATINDPQVTVTMTDAEHVSPSPPLTDEVTGPVKKLANEMWPGVPVLPVLMTGATDGAKLTAAGIPVFGIDALFTDADMNHIHGLNEYAGVEDLFKDRDFLFRLVKAYADK